jgi:hypothetical protein
LIRERNIALIIGTPMLDHVIHQMGVKKKVRSGALRKQTCYATHTLPWKFL